MSSIDLGYWLMFAGALLVVVGVVGLALRRNKEDETDPVALPGEAPWRDPPSDLPSGLLSNSNDRASLRDDDGQQRTRTESTQEERADSAAIRRHY